MKPSPIVELDDMPYTPHRRTGSKYDKHFERLVVGKCVKCDTDMTNAVAQALRKWLEAHGRTDCIVRQRTVCADGAGRVWLLPAKKRAAPLAAAPAPVAKPAATKPRSTPTLADLPRRVHRIE